MHWPSATASPGAIGLMLEPIEALQDAVRKLRLALDPLPTRGPFHELLQRDGVPACIARSAANCSPR